MKKRIFVVLSAVLCLLIVLTGCGQKAAPEAGAPESGKTVETPKMKVGFILSGPISDGGYVHAHNLGRLMVEEELGVETLYKESVKEGPDVEKVARDMIDQGATAIFATSFGYMDYVEKLAKEFPEVKFFHSAGYKSSENMVNYFGRMEEPRYLSGIVAGLKTKTNKIGYVASFSFPEVIRGIDAFALGVQSVNPDAVVSVTWTHTWYDPAKEKEAAKALLDDGADVITQHQNSAGAQQAAEERGVWSIGYNADMTAQAPKAHLTAAAWNWGPYYVSQVKALMEGTWKAENYLGGIADGMVVLTPLTENAPPEAKEIVAEIEKQMKEGTFHIFSGPIKDQTGSVKIPEGKVYTDEEMLQINWFVEGIKGTIETN